MKVIHVIPFCNGGSSKVVEDILLGMADYFDQELVILQDLGKCNVETLLAKGIKVTALNISYTKNPFICFKLATLMKNGDIIIASLFPAMYWVPLSLIFTRKVKRPKLVFIEHASLNNRRKVKLLNHIEKFIYGRYDRIIGVSNSVSDNIRNWIENQRKITTINNGIDIESYKALAESQTTFEREEYGEKFLICWVTRLSPDKELKTPIEAMKVLGNDYRLLVVGDGQLEQQARQYVVDMGVADKVSFLGYRTDVGLILSKCDINVLSTYGEGLPMSVLESLSVGTPTIASHVVGVTDVLTDDRFLFEPLNAVDLAKKIEHIAPIKPQLQQYIYETIIKFDIRITIDRYIKLLNNL